MKKKKFLIILILILVVVSVICGCTSKENNQKQLFIRYSEFADGKDFTETWSTGQDYMGIAFAETAPIDKSEYAWVMFKGDKGDKGDIGEAGKSSFIHIRYSGNSDGTDFRKNWTKGLHYLGIAVGETAPTDKSEYTWINLKGEKGDPGKSSYTHIRYSANADGTGFTSTWSKGQEYIGFAVTDSNKAPLDKSSYTWVQLAVEGGTNIPSVSVKTAKVLSIGNSFSQDATTYLWDIYKDAGYDTVIIGNLYIGGCTLDTHWNNINNNLANYVYYKNETGVWETYNNSTVLSALKDEDWDVITLQQASGDSGVLTTYSNINNIIKYINENKTNMNALLYWHMTWAYQQDSSHVDFSKYGKDQLEMYDAIINTVKEKILSNEQIDGVIPSGTSVQNLRTSSLGDTITRDGYHMSYDIGRYITGLTYFAELSGEDISTIDYLPSNQEYANNISKNMSIIKEAVNNAISSPYKTVNCGNV